MIESLLVVVATLLVGVVAGGAYTAYKVRRVLRALRADVTSTRTAVSRISTTTRDETRPDVHGNSTSFGDLSTEFAAVEGRIVAQMRSLTGPLKPGKQSVDQRTRRAVVQDLHALATLHSAFPMAAESLPYTSYAASPDTVLHLTTVITALPAGAHVLEFGGGISTVYMAAAAARENRGIMITSVDHDAGWGSQTSAALSRLGLSSTVDVRIAPLEAIEDGAESSSRWYSSDVIDDLRPVNLLVVDGPPESTGRKARFPAVPRLIDRLAPGARIVLDDTDREDEQEILRSWLDLLSPERAPAIERVMERTTVIRLDAGSAADRT